MTARAARDDSRIPVVETGEPIGRRPAATHPAPHLPGGVPARESGCPASGHGGSAAGHRGHCRTAYPAAGPRIEETAAHAPRAVQVEIIVPVHTEQDDPPRAVQTLHRCLVGQFPFRTLVTMADNGSADRTCEIGAPVAARLPGGPAGTDRTARPGGALAKVWTSGEAEVLACMDVDLSTNLNALLPAWRARLAAARHPDCAQPRALTPASPDIPRGHHPMSTDQAVTDLVTRARNGDKQKQPAAGRSRLGLSRQENQVMTAEVDSAAAPPDPARRPVAAAHPPKRYRRGGTSPVHLAPTRTGADSARDDPVVIDLVTRAGQGDEQAWDTLVERYAPLLWSICRRHRLDNADAEDVGQSVWLQLLDQLDKIRDPAALPGWLATVTRRKCLRVLGAARGPLTAGHTLDAEALPDERAGTAEQELLAAERHAALREAFQDLPPSGQRLLHLLFEDPPLPYAEISARLGIPVGSIGPTRRRCLDKLRRHPAIAALINAGTTSPDEMHDPAAARP